MNDRLTHEACSELLLPYVQGELDGARAAAVRAHLETCDDCSSELAALRSLTAAEDAALTEIERQRLRKAVLNDVRPQTQAAVVPPPSRWRRGMAAYASAAAVLVLLVAGGAWVFQGGLGGSDASDGEAVSGGADSELEDSDRGPAPAAEEGGGGDSSRAGDSAYKLAARPTFAPYQGPIDDRGLREIGRSRLFASLVSGDVGFESDGRDSYGPRSLLEALAEEAPDDLASEIQDCGRRSLQLAAGPALPTYATTATIAGRDVLVLGFASADSSSEVLDRFLFVAWARGACDEIVDRVRGPIRN